MIKNNFICILITCFISGCSLQSKQLDFAKEIFLGSNSKEMTPSWIMNWGGFSFEMFAINYEKNIIFANDDGLLVIFDGKTITRVEGLLPNNEIMGIRSLNDNYEYFIGNEILFDLKCDDWRKTHQDDSYNLNLLNQACNYDDEYLNEITKNHDNQIINIKYKINPNYPHLRLQYVGK